MKQKFLSILALLMVSVVSTTHLHAASLNWSINQVYQSANSSATASGYAAYMFVTANTTDVTVSNVTTLSDVTTLINQGNISDAIALATVSGSVSNGRISGATDISINFSTGTLTAFAIIFDAADAASAEHYFLVNGGNTSSVTFTSGTGVKTISFGNQNSGETSSTVAANWRSVRAPATQYDLTKADGSEAHGTVTFTVNNETVTQACNADVVTVNVAPNEGYSAKDVTVRGYTSWEAAADVLTGGGENPGLVSDINVTKQENGTWQFTMPEANVWVVVTYAKNVQDAWIEWIADQTWTGSAIEPTVYVMDGETELVLNTDYTVAYSNNVETGTATVTVTGIGNYGGTATKTFTIVADKTKLIKAIFSAEFYYESIKDDHPTAAATFLEAINAAKAMQEKGDATQAEVEAAIAALASARTTAEQTVLTETKTELNDAITEAEAYYNSISETNPDAAAALLTAINAAKDVQGNADATQSEIETAAQTLNEAVDAAKADVALKRVTLVIPAKSYMARIDADKRQIENGVDGVKLYSVKSVTATEVVLTDELSVIAAEMPYFIYNDNDTEVEVSIVVSSEEADNVDYDSEHFKGTLVDKTFTDEDMEGADHYVLNGGSSFVWVKDAGTLAAGKCWIQLEKSPANARSLSIVFEEGTTTGINAVKTAAGTEDAAVYDLQGRRVMEPTKKGLYIVNGKKVVMK